MFSDTPQTITLAIGTASQIPMANTMPSSNVTYTPANSVTVATAGNYEISYQVNGTAALAASVTVAVRNNGANIPSLTMTRALTAGTNTVYQGSAIVSLTAGNVIDLALSALLAVGVTLGSGTNALLTVKKLNA